MAAFKSDAELYQMLTNDIVSKRVYKFPEILTENEAGFFVDEDGHASVYTDGSCIGFQMRDAAGSAAYWAPDHIA